MATYYAAVDMGASSGRLILGHMENGKIELEEIHRFENGMVKKDGELCWEFDRLFQEIKNGLKKCKEIGKIPVSMGVDTWGVDVVLLDKDDKVLGNTVGYRDHRTEGMDEEVKKPILEAAEVLKNAGAEIEEFDLGLVKYAIPAYYVIASAEASSNLSRFDGVKYGYRTKDYEELHQMYKKTRSEGFGPEVKRRIMLGSFVLSSGYYDAYYLKALRTKALIKKAFDSAFAKYDMILTPAAPTTAPKLGASLSDPIKMYLGDIYTISVNLAGLPGISIPVGRDAKGLPVGMQLIGDCFQEKKLFQAAYTYECLTEKKWVSMYDKTEAAGKGEA